MMGKSIEQQIVLYGNVQLVAGILALIFLAAAAVLFFSLRIPQAVGELTGKRARKEMSRMAADTSESGRIGRASGRLMKNRKRRGSGGRNRLAVAENSDCGEEPFFASETAEMKTPEGGEGTVILNTSAFPAPDFAVERTIMLIHTGDTL